MITQHLVGAGHHVQSKAFYILFHFIITSSFYSWEKLKAGDINNLLMKQVQAVNHTGLFQGVSLEKRSGWPLLSLSLTLFISLTNIFICFPINRLEPEEGSVGVLLLWDVLNAFKNLFIISINLLVKFCNYSKAKSIFPIPSTLLPHIPCALAGGCPLRLHT